MNQQHVRIKVNDSDAGIHSTENSVQSVSTYTLARSLTLENFASLLDHFLNAGGKGFRDGKEIGLQLRSTHRTLQRLAICFALGMVTGLSEQEYSDPRNESAIKSAKRLAKMLEDGELPLGMFI
jgi:hypothetical protein